ncbi:hypothetical protein D3C77_501250 [compost metagenome]
MSQGGENQQGRTDHHGEDANIEKQRAGDMDITQQRQVQVSGMRGQERIAEEHCTCASEGGTEQASAHPAQWAQTHLRLHPLGAGDHVLEDKRHRHHQPGDKAAARLVVSAHEQVHRHHQGNRQQQTYQYCRNHHEPQRRVGSLAWVDQVGDNVGGQQSLLSGQLHAFAWWAETAQQGKYRQCHRDQHCHFTQGVEAAEVHEHDIDHVATAAFGQCATEVERRNIVRGRTGQHRIGQHSHAATHQERQN